MKIFQFALISFSKSASSNKVLADIHLLFFCYCAKFQYDLACSWEIKPIKSMPYKRVWVALLVQCTHNTNKRIVTVTRCLASARWSWQPTRRASATSAPRDRTTPSSTTTMRSSRYVGNICEIHNTLTKILQNY